MIVDNEIILDTKLVGEITGEYFIPSYQRGYRWCKDEVIRLLDDIYQNGKKNYCLQPVVVKKRSLSYELIDGQQRLTTLYLIYKYMNNVNPFFSDPAFSLVYETRDCSADFLKNIDLSKREDNIDFWFIANAYDTIRQWFEVDMQIRVMHIFAYLKENVKIIWYEVGENEDAISLFTRLNIGKIPLTSAELVKAMFLCRYSGENINKEKQEEISLQWDNIEKELHNASLWYFLTNSLQNKYQTRIDLILDLISDKREDVREKYFTFFKFNEMRKDHPLEEIWRKIQQTFLVLKDWYEDHEFYHKIGFLIASGSLKLYEIFDLSSGKTKGDFRAALNSCIRKSIEIDGNYAEMSYEKPLEYKKISKLLLLFNVESVRKNGAHTQWFPFDKFKDCEDNKAEIEYSDMPHESDKGNKISWSLEHIHAQQSEGMRTQEMWKEWLRRHIPSVRAVADNQAGLVQEMENAVEKTQLARSEFDELQQRVVELLSVSGNTEYLHSIANLALLNSSDNAALNNSTFDVKRNIIIERDKEGKYIPFCTKMAFLKYYTPSESNQLHFWGQSDRIAYVEAINRVLAEYLTEPITLEKEVS